MEVAVDELPARQVDSAEPRGELLITARNVSNLGVSRKLVRHVR